jgi:hypothetical protein
MDGATVTLVFVEGREEDEEGEEEEEDAWGKPFSRFLDGIVSFGAVAPKSVDHKDGPDILYSINRK